MSQLMCHQIQTGNPATTASERHINHGTASAINTNATVAHNAIRTRSITIGRIYYYTDLTVTTGHQSGHLKSYFDQSRRLRVFDSRQTFANGSRID